MSDRCSAWMDCSVGSNASLAARLSSPPAAASDSAPAVLMKTLRSMNASRFFDRWDGVPEITNVAQIQPTTNGFLARSVLGVDAERFISPHIFTVTFFGLMIRQRLVIYQVDQDS